MPATFQTGDEVTPEVKPTTPEVKPTTFQTGDEVKPIAPEVKPTTPQPPKAGLLDVQPGEDWSKEPWWQRPISSFLPKPDVTKPTVASPTEEAAAKEITQKPKAFQQGEEVSTTPQAPQVPLPEQIEALKQQHGNAEDALVAAAKQPQEAGLDEAGVGAVKALLKDKKFAPSTDEYVGRAALGFVQGVFTPETWVEMGKFAQTMGQVPGIMQKVASGQPLDYQDNAVLRTITAGMESGDEMVKGKFEDLRNFMLGHDPTGAMHAIYSSLGGKTDQTMLSMEQIAKLPEDQQAAIIQSKLNEARNKNQIAEKRMQGEISPEWQGDIEALVGRKLATQQDLAGHGITVDPQAAAGVASNLNALNAMIPGLGEVAGPLTGGLLRPLLGFGTEKLGQGILTTLGKEGVAEAIAPKIGKKLGGAAVSMPIRGLGWTNIPFPFNLAADPVIKGLVSPLKAAGEAAGERLGGIPQLMRTTVWEPMGQMVLQIGKDIRTEGTGFEANYGPLAQLFRGVAGGAVKGAVGAIPFTIGAPTPEEAGQTIGGGAALGAAMHVIPSGIDAAMNSVFFRGGREDMVSHPKIDYGTQYGQPGNQFDLDHAHNKFVNNPANPLNPREQQAINNLRGWYPGIEIYLTDHGDYQDAVTRFQNAGILDPNQPNLKTRGINILDPGTGKPVVLLDGEARYTRGGILDTAHHEIGHAIYQTMSAAQKEAFKNAGANWFDMDQFTRGYIQKIGGPDGVNYSDLPTEAQVKSGARNFLPGLDGFTQETMNEEMGAETVAQLLHGEPLENFEKDPSRLRQLQMGFGQVLNKLGMNVTPEKAVTILGARPGMAQMLLMDKVIRDYFQANPSNKPSAAGPPAGGGGGPKPTGGKGGRQKTAPTPPPTGGPAPGPTPSPTGGPTPKVTNNQPEIGGGSTGALPEAVEGATKALIAMGIKKGEAKAYAQGASGQTADEIAYNAFQQYGRDNRLAPKPRPTTTPATPQEAKAAEAPVPPQASARHNLMQTDELVRRVTMGDELARQTLLERHGANWLEAAEKADPQAAQIYRRKFPDDAKAQDDRIKAQAQAEESAKARAKAEGRAEPKPVDAARIAELRTQAERDVPRVGYMPEEEEYEGPRTFRNRAEHEAAIHARHLHLVMGEHNAMLDPNDTRVRLRVDPDSGRRTYYGTHFDPSDPVHSWLVSQMDPQERDFMARAQAAIAAGVPMTFNYTHAPKMGRKWIPSGPEREAEYEASEAKARAAGESTGQVGIRTFLPQSIGVGADGQGLAYGMATDKILGNIVKADRAMRGKTPYGHITRDNLPTLIDDMRKVGENHRAGWRGDGSAPLVGTVSRPVNVNPHYTPQLVQTPHAQFINMVMNARDPLMYAKVSKKGALTQAGKAVEFAEANKGYTFPFLSHGQERTEVNPMRQALEKKGAFKGRELEHGYEQFRADLMRPTTDPAPAIRKHGFKSFDVMAGPERRYAAAGFMPLEPDERLEHAALRYKGSGQIYTAKYHRAAEQMADAAGEPPLTWETGERGFVTNKGRYVSQNALISEARQKSKVGYMPLAGPEAKGFGEAERRKVTFMSRLAGRGKQFEIDDRDMHWAPAPKGATEKTMLDYNWGNSPDGTSKLGEVISHPELFKNYPSLRDAIVEINPHMRGNGSWEPRLSWDEPERITLRTMDKGTLAHEIQHAVQYRENWPGGSSPKRMLRELQADPAIEADLQNAYSARWPEAGPTEFPDQQSYFDYMAYRAEHFDNWYRDRIARMANSRYLGEPGEVEARVAGQRAKEPPGERLPPVEHVAAEQKAAQEEAAKLREKMDAADLLAQGPFENSRPGSPSQAGYMPEELPELRGHGADVEGAKRMMIGERIVGAPRHVKTVEDVLRLKDHLRQLMREGAMFRHWYKEGSQEMYSATAESMPRFEQLISNIAVTSPQNTVYPNAGMAVRAMAQQEAGGRRITIGKTKSMAKRLAAIARGERWKGVKTNQFYRDHMAEVDQRLAGDIGSTMDVWMARAFGYPADSFSDVQSKWAQEIIRQITDEEGWGKPKEAQAAIWSAIKARWEAVWPDILKEAKANGDWVQKTKKSGKKFMDFKDPETNQLYRNKALVAAMKIDPPDLSDAAFNFGDALRRDRGYVSYETRPGASAINDRMSWMNTLTQDEWNEYHQEAAKILHDENGYNILAQAAHLLTGDEHQGFSAWGPQRNLSQQLAAVMPKAAGKILKATGQKFKIDPTVEKHVRDFAAAVGLLFRQEGVGFHRPYWMDIERSVSGKRANGVLLDQGRPLTQEETGSLVDNLEKVLPSWENDGKKGWFVAPEDRGLKVVSWGHPDGKKINVIVQNVARDTLPDTSTLTARQFATYGELVSNNWEKDQNGEGYRRWLTTRGRSDLLGLVDDTLAPRLAELNARYATRYGARLAGEPGGVSVPGGGGERAVGYMPEGAPEPVPMERGPPALAPPVIQAQRAQAQKKEPEPGPAPVVSTETPGPGKPTPTRGVTRTVLPPSRQRMSQPPSQPPPPSKEPGIDIQSASYRQGRTTRPRWIVLHATDAGENSSINSLTQGNLSVHYLTTKDGRLLHFVNEGDTAFHAGRDKFGRDGNPGSIGFEQVHYDGKEPWDDAQVRATAKGVAGAMQRWGIPMSHIVGHSDLAGERKQDPVDYPWDRFYGYVRQYLGQGEAAPVNRPRVTGVDTRHAAEASAARIMREEGSSGVQDGVPEIFGFREGEDSEYPELARLRASGDEEGVRRLATRGFIHRAIEAGSRELNDVGLKAQLMSLAHMRGPAGARQIIEMAGGAETLNRLSRTEALQRIAEARTAYDHSFRGPDYWARFGRGLSDRYAREQEFYGSLS